MLIYRVEVQKLRNKMFTDNYGFIVDYLAEILKELRKEDHMHDYKQLFHDPTVLRQGTKMPSPKPFPVW